MADVSFDCSLGEFQHDSAGIRQIFRGAGMRAALQEPAMRIANYATAEARGRTDEAVFGGGVDVLRGTAVGWVGTSNEAARMDQSEYHTLEHYNH